jgi:drug/metabolite transporter (DMT)-like permease
MTISILKARFLAMPDNLKGIATVLVAAIGFTCMVALIKYAGQNLHVTQILFIRQIVMVLIVLPGIISHFPESLKTSRLDLQVYRIIGATIAMLFGFYAIIHMPLAEATAIGFAKSFFVTIAAIIILKEKVGPRRWVAVLIGFIGVIVMVQPGGDGFNYFSIYALIGSASAGLVMVIIRKLSQTDSPTTILTYQAIAVGVLVAIPAWYYWTSPSLNEWILLISIGIISYGAQMLNVYAYKWGEASLLASIDYVRLLYATIFGYLLFSQIPGPYTWIGSGIIISASIYTIHRERKHNQNLARSPHGRGYTN